MSNTRRRTSGQYQGQYQGQYHNPRYNKRDPRMFFMLLLAAALVLVIAVLPKTPVTVAVNANLDPGASSHQGLIISEVMSDKTAAIPDETGSFGDWLELHNTLDVPMSLKGVGLSDRPDRIIFLFPEVTLAPGGRVVVFCDDVNRDNPKGTFHAKFKLKSLGNETIYLFDAISMGKRAIRNSRLIMPSSPACW